MSSPSDVYEYYENVKHAIDEFNNSKQSNSRIKVFFNLRHWKTDTHPNMGKSAQDEINEQLVDNCEHCIAVFGGKIGTKTKRDLSGTIEEIKKISEKGGTAMVYFAEGKTVNLQDIDPEQLAKLKEYKKTIEGLYETFNSAEELEKLLKKDLKLLADEFAEKHFEKRKIAKENEEKLNIISLKSFAKNEVNENIVFEKLDLKPIVDKMNLLKKSICNKIQKINSIHINEEEKSEEFKIFKNFKKSSLYLEAEKFEFDKNQKIIISNFAIKNHNLLAPDFYDFGNAKLVKKFYGNTETEGSVIEKEKANLAWDMYVELIEYNGTVDFFNLLKNKSSLTLVLDNDCKKFCEDIEIELSFDKQKFFDARKLTFKNELTEKSISTTTIGLLKPKRNFDVEDLISPEPAGEIHAIPTFKGSLQKLYNYQMKVVDNKIFIKLKMKELRQYNKRYICGKLLFKKPIDKIEYSITSKSIPNKIKGSITL